MKLLKGQPISPIDAAPGDTVVIEYRDENGVVNEVLRAEIEEAVVYDYAAALQLDEGDLRAMGLPSLDKGLAGLFGRRKAHRNIGEEFVRSAIRAIRRQRSKPVPRTGVQI